MQSQAQDILLDTQFSVEERCTRIAQAFDLEFSSIFEVTAHTGLRSIEGRASEWLRHYNRRGYLPLDPVVRRACETFNHLPSPAKPQGFGWQDVVVDATPRQARIFLEASDFGMRQGFVVPFGIPGVRGGMICFHSAHEREFGRSIALQRQDICEASKSLFMQFSNDNEKDYITPHLSEREMMCLHYIAQGLSSHEVAEIMRIKPRTVDAHVTAAQHKLGTLNRTATAVKAAQLGLIMPFFDTIPEHPDRV